LNSNGPTTNPTLDKNSKDDDPALTDAEIEDAK